MAQTVAGRMQMVEAFLDARHAVSPEDLLEILELPPMPPATMAGLDATIAVLRDVYDAES